MSYSVKELIYTLQGEGANTGRPAVFCRFAGCNLWSGREEDRETAVCDFCDTDFVGTDGEGGDITRPIGVGKFVAEDVHNRTAADVGEYQRKRCRWNIEPGHGAHDPANEQSPAEQPPPEVLVSLPVVFDHGVVVDQEMQAHRNGEYPKRLDCLVTGTGD